MNLQKLKDILDSGNPYWEQLLLEELSNDETVIPKIMDILNFERNNNKKVLVEMNALLAQADTIIEQPKLNNDNFFGKKVADFYTKHKNTKQVFHCFKAD